MPTNKYEIGKDLARKNKNISKVISKNNSCLYENILFIG